MTSLPLKTLIWALLGLVFLVFLLFTVLRDYSAFEFGPMKAEAPESGLLAPEFRTMEIAQLQPALDRPLFNSTRRPFADEEVSDQLDNGPVTAEIKAPEIRLSGVILTAKHKIAMLVNKKNKQNFRVMEGEVLPEEFSDWTLKTVSERSLELVHANSDDTVMIELEVFGAIAAAVPPPEVKSGPEEKQATEQTPQAENTSEAEEIRRKIAERRARLRAEAARRQAEKPEEQ